MLAILEGKGYLNECQVTPDADPYEYFYNLVQEDSCVLKKFQARFNKRQNVILMILGDVPHTNMNIADMNIACYSI